MILIKALDDDVRRIADRLEPKVRRAFLDAIASLKASLSIAEIENLLESGALRQLAPLRDEAIGAIQAALVQTASEAGTRVGVSFELINPRAVRWAQRHAAELVTQVDSETQQALRRIITRGQTSGLNIRSQARLIRETVGLTARDAMAVQRFAEGLADNDIPFDSLERQTERYSARLLRRRAENIARTETLRSANQGVQMGWQSEIDRGNLPRDARKQWIITNDERLCPRCAVMEDQVVDVMGQFTQDREATAFSISGDDVRIAESREVAPTTTLTPPLHASCVPGDTLVSTVNGITAVSERVFVGNLVILSTDQERLRVTPNHPILTGRGWVPAGEVVVGDDVVHHSLAEGMVGLANVDDKDVPTPIEKVAKAFRESPFVVSVPVPMSAEDFHGDGEGSEVAVVYVDGLLWDNRDAPLDKPVHELSLVGSDELLPGGSRSLRSLNLGLSGLGTASAGVMCRHGLRPALSGSHLRPLQQFGFGASAGFDSRFEQASTDGSARDTEAVRQSLLGFSRQVSAHKVVNIDVESFHGPVYNLETPTGYYIAGDLVVHNCRCSLGLVV